MNERIRELADESAKYSATMFLPTGKNGDELFIEKFAELIIQECASIARQTNLEKAGRSYMVHKAIKEKFSIE
jgi:hypothetical protein